MDAVIGIANESAAEVATVSANPNHVGILLKKFVSVIFLFAGDSAGVSTTINKSSKLAAVELGKFAIFLSAMAILSYW